MEVYEETGARHGLVANAAKSKVLIHPQATPEALPANLPPTVLFLDVVGTPLAPSHDAHTAALRGRWDAKVAKLAARTAILGQLQHPQWVLRALIQASTWTRLKSIASPAPIGRGPSLENLDAMDATDRALLALALGDYAHGLGATEWLWASLPRKLGGLGVQHVTKEFHLDMQFSGDYLKALEGGDSRAAREVVARRDARRAEANDDLLVTLLRTLNPERKVNLLDNCGSESSGAWIEVDATAQVGSSFSTLLTAKEASVAIATRLGMPVLPEGHECRDGDAAYTTAAGSPVYSNVSGHHASSCLRTFHVRHAGMVGAIWHTLKRHGCRGMMREAAVGSDGRPRKAREGERRPGDVALIRPQGE